MPSPEPEAALVVDLGAVVSNYRLIGDAQGGVPAAAVVKDDAYGLGATAVATALSAAGCETFVVARPEEGAVLRTQIAAPRIIVLNGPRQQDLALFREHRLLPVLNSLDQIALWRTEAGKAGGPSPAALHVDTGMNRLGLAESEVQRLEDAPDLVNGIVFDLVISHLACADDPGNPMNEAQRARFDAVLARLAPTIGRPARSLANSSGIFLGPAFHYDLTRPGVALYGVNPLPGQPNPMRQPVSIRAEVLQVRDVDAGTTVGYGAAHRVAGPRQIATIPVGYANGLWRALGGRLEAKVAGLRVPVVGRISMDLTTIDVTEVPPGQVRPGTVVELVGDVTPVDRIAEMAGTIGYEVLTSLGHRLPRRYIETGA
ncbi:MAG: alanine racemase [Rhodospirillaceae bacterium]|nr:alanine racemase [Rhodospirillaceae bacterium]